MGHNTKLNTGEMLQRQRLPMNASEIAAERRIMIWRAGRGRGIPRQHESSHHSTYTLFVATTAWLIYGAAGQCATPPEGAYFRVTAASPLYACGEGETATGASAATCFTNADGSCFTDGPGNCMYTFVCPTIQFALLLCVLAKSKQRNAHNQKLELMVGNTQVHGVLDA